MFLIFNFVVFFKKNILLTWFGKHAWKKERKKKIFIGILPA